MVIWWSLKLSLSGKIDVAIFFKKKINILKLSH